MPVAATQITEQQVYLSGTVTSLEARQQAIKIAWNTPGMKSVVNTLVVQK